MTRLTLPLAALALLVVAGPASAHIGHGVEASVSGGMMHAFGGWDHALAAIGVGLWAMLSGTRYPLVWPATFLGVTTASAIAAAHGLVLPLVEPAIILSVIALGVVIALRVGIGTALGAIVIGVFALAHGQAHGIEGGASASYLAGLIVATAVLHAVGMAIARLGLTLDRPVLARSAGAVIAVAGVAMLAV